MDIPGKETAPGESGRQEGCCVGELLGKTGGAWECGDLGEMTVKCGHMLDVGLDCE